MAKKILRILNGLLNTMIAIVLVLAVLYSVYSLWDNFQFYNGVQDLKVKLRQLKPKGNKPSFEELRKINPDVVAWITLDGTKIDEPVVQGKDNLEYYQKSKFAQKHNTGTLMIPGKKYPLKIFASMIVESSDPYLYDPSKYKTDKDNFLNYIKTKAVWMSDDQIEKLRSNGSQYGVLAMSTCSASAADDRMVVLAMYKK